ncbi:MAG: 1-acyl-sn-glycerol-3-phosphate acyltransferase [Acidimicrobiia bacterium]|nr:1-acyl-sn-glycerol-3-phosphate acyltransferase [Acidimicrobiia bacterium]
MRRVRDWIFTVPFLIAFGMTLVVYDVAGRLVRPFSLRGFEYVMAALQRTLMNTFRICGTRIIVEQSTAIRPRTGYAIISNHQSMFDIVLIGGILFSNFPKYVAKKELGRWFPSISLNLRWGGNAIIDRTDRARAVATITEMARTAQRRNVSVAIFPEGTRSRDGRLQRFKRAGRRALLEAADELPVVPVAVDGAWRLLQHNLKPVPFGTTVRVRFGDPIPREPGDAAAIAKQAEAWIGATLDEWHSTTNEPTQPD